MNWINYLTVFCVIIIANFMQIECSGVFELKLKTFLNANGKDNQNLCCSGRSDPTTGKCIGSCKTRFRVCLKHYQAKIDTSSPCTFGDVSTPVLGDNNVDLQQQQQTNNNNSPFNTNNISINPIQFPFDFTWPGTFTLIIEAWHTSSNETWRSSDSLISRIAIQRVLDVKPEWTPDMHESILNKSLTFEYRVTCENHYYGKGCAILCRGRDDGFGHYTCSAAGERVCQTGWTGEYCDKPRCLPGCDESHGHCTKPNECICQAGWKGPLCNECEPYPGCVHGTCKTPWQCICKEGWGGLFCNQDLNYCTNHKPCLNGGTCFNTGEGLYTCQCPPGFTGSECQTETSDCSTNPCQNGGTCLEMTKGYKCECHKGWIGKHCEEKTIMCSEKPCLHGTCKDTKLGFKCDCPLGYSGKNCETQVNECNPNPCDNGGSCVNKGDAYKCSCPSGFQGTRCEVNIDDCQGNPCRNGGSCVDMVNQFRCQCVPGFIGSTCENKVDLCLTKPCANGGSCINLNNDYRCNCRPGFTGKDCSIDIDECLSNPCRNGATCVNRVNSFQCVCAGGFRGKTCDEEALSAAAFDGGSSSRHVAVTADSDANDGLSGGQIALIAIFSISMPLTAFIAAAVVICMKRRRKREQEKDDAEARKQNEQNASHISRIHDSSINLKRNSNSSGGMNCDMAPHVIKNTWDKSVNNITNSQSMDDCLMNSSLYGGLSSYSDNSANECYQQQQLQQQQQQQQPSLNEMHRAKSQKQLNTDPIKMMHRASQIITSPSPPNTQTVASSATTKDLTTIYDMKRISVLSDAALCNTRWPTSAVSPLPRQLVATGSPHCSPPHM